MAASVLLTVVVKSVVIELVATCLNGLASLSAAVVVPQPFLGFLRVTSFVASFQPSVDCMRLRQTWLTVLSIWQVVPVLSAMVVLTVLLARTHLGFAIHFATR